jgi:hypothetical protein
MSNQALPGLSGGGAPLSLPERAPSAVEHVVISHPLHHVLAFTGHSIHDVINDPIARNQVFGYYKLHKQVTRACEVIDLERWWNGRV